MLIEVLRDAGTLNVSLATPEGNGRPAPAELVVEAHLSREFSVPEVAALSCELAEVADGLHRAAGGAGLRLAELHAFTPRPAEANGLGHVLRLRLADRGRRPAARRLERVRQGLDEAAWQQLNRRRQDLALKESKGGLTGEEEGELEQLQQAWSRKLEPEDTTRLERIKRLVLGAERSVRRTAP